jgi:hypothetical protein
METPPCEEEDLDPDLIFYSSDIDETPSSPTGSSPSRPRSCSPLAGANTRRTGLLGRRAPKSVTSILAPPSGTNINEDEELKSTEARNVWSEYKSTYDVVVKSPAVLQKLTEIKEMQHEFYGLKQSYIKRKNAKGIKGKKSYLTIPNFSNNVD